MGSLFNPAGTTISNFSALNTPSPTLSPTSFFSSTSIPLTIVVEHEPGFETSASSAAITVNVTDSNWTSPIGSATGTISEATDNTLWFFTRLIAIVVILLPIVICIGYFWWRQKVVPHDGHTRRWCRCYKIKQCLWNTLCCGYCCGYCHSQVGLDKLKPNAGHWLRVTLISATGIEKRSSFYFELWTEPFEGWPKKSRVHKDAHGTCELGYEQVQMEWHGDEDYLVIQALSYSGTTETADRPICEVRITRDQIWRYTQECQARPMDMHAGARAHALRGCGHGHHQQRLQRFKNMNIFVPVLPAMAQLVAKSQGYGTDDQELQALREENQRLQAQLGQSSPSSPLGSYTNSDASITMNMDKVMMNVVIRIEILQMTMAPDVRMFQGASFYEYGPYQGLGQGGLGQQQPRSNSIFAQGSPSAGMQYQHY